MTRVVLSLILTFVMHAYLFVGGNENCLNREIDKLNERLKTKILQYPIKSIEDVRSLGKFTRLSLREKTSILIRNIDFASIEALNAFLKDLEEPQENLTYFLTTKSIYKVMSTIISRCQVIRLQNEKEDINLEKMASDFINSDVLARFTKIEGIKDRELAKNFIQDFITGCYLLIHKKSSNKEDVASAVSSGQDALSALNANGNVNLQLTNFALKV